MGIFGLIFSVVSTVAQISASRKAARAQREGRAIQSASQDIQDRLGRRRLAREERIRRARLVQGAVGSGAVGSSGLAGATSALAANRGAAIADQSGQSLAAKGISAANQRYADAQSILATWDALGGLVGAGNDYGKTQGWWQ